MAPNIFIENISDWLRDCFVEKHVGSGHIMALKKQKVESKVPPWSHTAHLLITETLFKISDISVRVCNFPLVDYIYLLS